MEPRPLAEYPINLTADDVGAARPGLPWDRPLRGSKAPAKGSLSLG